MLRLRTTVTLSLLALGVGVAGTQWLSGFGTGWSGPSERVAGFAPPAHRIAAARAARRRASSQPHVVAVVHRAVLPPVVDVVQAAPVVPPPELVPVSMPEVAASWSQMEGHLQGRVLLHLAIDGGGRVIDASLAESSGDPVLDAHALATVRNWRFAVPADHPEGFSGDLPMRFTTGSGQQVAQAL
ncbi:energy transducer TonB [Rhodanobacter sp. DHG33]|uniref:energy transducer TonB family protein n=1 Tax=Rhodanobacter sp. DHG33 TaxID=2775921 RepID=UPI0017807D09|nr:energy transducer TonB [Rhodanobacter sp. DHG33]MBD8898850.1 energy transducer TonB [Rhodanobacter sp. DHG33]